MAKFLPDAIIDGMLNYFQLRITGISVCSTQPTTYTEATSTYKLADKNGLTSTYLTLGNGDTSGRKVTMAANNGVAVDASGTAAHVAWWGSSGSTLLLVTTCTTQALTSGNTVNIPAHDFEIRDVA
jgi:hypothetical protein